MKRKPGRPKLSPEKRRSEVLEIFVTPVDAEKVEKHAKESGFSNVSEWGNNVLPKLVESVTTHQYPLLGLIAGGPAMTVKHFPDNATVRPPFQLKDDCYALVVVGDSMENSRGYGPSIPDGSYAFFCPETMPHFGAIVHAEFPQVDGVNKCSLKRYCPQPDGSAIFEPLNKTKHKPFHMKPGDFEIRGVFVRAWDGKAPEEEVH